jgi:hypothetical protein
VAKKVIIPGVEPGRYTDKEIEDAKNDAVLFVKDCKAAQVCLAADIISRRLYMLARGQLDAIIEEGWEIDNLPLVVQTLVMSAQEKANEKFSVAELRQQVQESLLPFLDLLVENEQRASSNTENSSSDVNRQSPEAA